MKFELVEDWKSVLKKAWSIKLAAIAGFFATAEAVLPLFTDVVPPKTMALMAALAAAGSAITRIFYQPKMHDD